MKTVKKEYLGQILSNGNVAAFNTNSITPEMIAYYEKQGFAHIFESEVPQAKKEVKVEAPISEEN